MIDILTLDPADHAVVVEFQRKTPASSIPRERIDSLYGGEPVPPEASEETEIQARVV